METLHNSSTAYIQPVKERSFKSATILGNNLLQTFPPWPNGGTVHPLWKESFFLMRSFLSYNKVSTPKTTRFIQHHLRISLNTNGLFNDFRTQVLWWCGGWLSPTMANSPLVFIEKGVKINGAYYQSEILQSQLEPNADELYPNATGFFNKILHQRTRRKWTKSGAGPIVLDLSAPTNGLRHHQTSTRSTFAYGEC